MKTKKILEFFTAGVFLVGGLTANAAWDINDVTYILPLPNQNLQSASILAEEVVNGNALIPLNFFNQAGGTELTSGDIIPRSAGFNSYANLFAVAVRIDPCFRDQFANPCRRQIRMVWQPVDHWTENQPITVDAAVHTFYDLSDSEFQSLLTQLQLLKNKYGISTRGLPLGLHPGFSKSGSTSFQTDLKQILLNYIDFSHLKRLAIINIGAFEFGWALFSHDFDGQNLSSVPIFNTPSNIQKVKNVGGLNVDVTSGTTADITQRVLQYLNSNDIHDSSHRTCGYTGTLMTASEQGDQLNAALMNSSAVTASPQTAQTYLTRAVRIENPSQNLPGTIDCLSCHSATMVKLLTLKSELPNPRVPTSPFNLTNTSRYYGDTHNLRMLGYINSDIQLGDRVINESAAVAGSLNNSSSGL